MPELNDLCIVNGLDFRTGTFFPPIPVAEIAAAAIGAPIAEEHLDELNARAGAEEKHFGVKYGVDPKDLAQAGWGVIFPPNSEAVQEALQELLVWRKSQAGPRFRNYNTAADYRVGMSALNFLTAHDMGPGPADPDRVPYYILLVGSPAEIPYEFQYQLDVQYAVGRIYFDELQEYRNYARSVVRAESPEHALPRRLAIFATNHPGDQATLLSSTRLAKPLADKIEAEATGWKVDRLIDASASKANLRALLADDPPALLFTATHGMSCNDDPVAQANLNGSLVCQDYPGGAPQPGHYFCAGDVPAEANLLGTICFHFACYGAGTPAKSDFLKNGQRANLSEHALVSSLPRKLLSHPNGGALAIVSHIDRAFPLSFLWDGAKSPQVEVFRSALRGVMDGLPIGAALEPFNMRYAELASLLSGKISAIQTQFIKVDDATLAGYWMASNDARNFIVLGDPAVRLKLATSPDGVNRLKLEAPAQPSSGPIEQLDYSLVGDTLKSVSQKIAQSLAKLYENLNTVDVCTYILPPGDQTQPPQLRARSVVGLDGKTQSYLPANSDGKLDAELWKLHMDSVDRALEHRIAALKLAANLASRILTLGQ